MRAVSLSLLLASLTAAALACMILVYPEPSLQASLKGISIWWDVLFPALFPFFVISELMLGIGIVHFFGMLLDPMMRPLFRIPGIGGFVMALGFASGYPVGARMTAQLYEQRLVNREEGERLVAFTTSSDPIFLIGAVAVGFFHNAALAGILAVAHYGSAILVGFLMRFHGRRSAGNDWHQLQNEGTAPRRHGIWKQAFEAMHQARLKDGRPLGVMAAQSLSSGLQMSFVIGGLVVFFSVVMEIMSSAGVMAYIYAGIQAVLHGAGLPAALAPAVVNGFFEVTLGAKAAGSAAGIPLVYQAAIAAWVLSWGGLSVHAQIVSVLHRTPLRYVPFAAARLIHGLLAASLVLLLWEPLASRLGVIPATAPVIDMSRPVAAWVHHTMPQALWLLTGTLVALLLLSACFYFFRLCMNRIRT
ncbi:sporulation integral membrane protein YlbJ [Paenibacillus sp. UNCCL117]|uniref:sporulation integral membrane protein YlbJ n=1 Tax=unclassified Paenibacillus TaxID=185978 RepID=UPI0008816EE5|nr:MULTISPECIES: sporulation integral membrane protein YlbJ [unclassified Paenibacillus]SDE01639.1 sporulation integral membrane protein YlbJ [Paenibacillus sp. cl123]SFW57036.1 sporulation integral membrane protein YlbJ [Paenibacillus sp. UNCCL117]